MPRLARPALPVPPQPVRPAGPRRRTVLGLGAALLAAPALAACASSTSAGTGTSDGGGEPVEGGTLRIALGSDTSIINPHLTGSSVAATIARDVVDSLVAQSTDNEIHPWLAESWDVDDASTQYTFTLRDGVTFSDGQPLTAQAVKTTFDYILDPANNSTYARSLLGPVDAVEAPDERTVVIRYTSSFAPLLQGLTLPYLGIASPAFLAGGGDLSGSIVGSGPFTLESWTQGKGSRLVRREDYAWAPESLDLDGASRLEAIEYSFLQEASTRLGALQSGQVDAIDAVPPADAATLAADGDIIVDSYENPGVPYAFQLNTTRAPFDDVRVRQAFQSAVDIESAVQAAFFGTVSAAAGILGPGTASVDTSIDGSWRNQPDRAAQLLDEAGWTQRDADGFRTKDGERLSVSWVYDGSSSGQENVTLVQALQSEYREAGIELLLESVDSGAYADRGAAGDYDLVAYNYVRAEPDILRTVYGSASVGSGNQARVTSLDEPLDAALGASGTDRDALYAQVQQEVIEQAYSVPLYVPVFQLAHSSRLQGVGWATNAKPLFAASWLEAGI